MADIKITNLPLGTDIADDDELLYIDVSDQTAGPDGTDKRVLVGSLRNIAERNATTEDLITSDLSSLPVGKSITTVGFYESGDGGGAQWVKTSDVDTPSQTPVQLGGAKFTDSEGVVWELANSEFSVKSLGGDAGDISSYIVAAINGGALSLLIDGDFECDINDSNVMQILKYINNLNVTGSLVFNIPAGETNLNSFIDIDNITARNIRLEGVERSNLTITSFGSASGTSLNHSVTVNVSDTSNINTGEYILFNTNSLSGTGRFKEIAGCWKVTSTTSTSVTFKHTHNDAIFPVMTLTGGTIRPLPSVLRWENGSRGLTIQNCDLQEVKGVVIAGSYDISTTSPSDGPDDGLQVGSASNSSNTGSSESKTVFSGSCYLTRVGVVEWTNNGVQNLGGNAHFNGAAFSANGWRGCQAAACGTVRAKFSASVGNGASGYESEGLGFTNAAGSVAAGNVEQGVYAINGSVIFNSDAYSGGNGTHGLDARNGGRVSADTSESSNNTLSGVYCRSGLVTIANGSIEGNSLKACDASVAGIVRLDNSSLSGDIENDGTAIIQNENGSLFSWLDASPTTFQSVNYTDDGTETRYINKNGVIFWDTEMKWTGLDTSDASAVSIDNLPSNLESSRTGDVSVSIRSSDGLDFSVDYYKPEYNSIVDTVVFSDFSGVLLKYNSGGILSSGSLKVSGWFIPG